MAEVTLIDFSYLNTLALSTFTGVGPQFSNQDSRLGPVVEKAKKLSNLYYPRSISVISAILISNVQPYPTSSGVAPSRTSKVIVTKADKSCSTNQVAVLAKLCYNKGFEWVRYHFTVIQSYVIFHRDYNVTYVSHFWPSFSYEQTTPQQQT